MGYNLYITRADWWLKNEGKEISSQEWLRVVDSDPELWLAGYNGPFFSIWSGPSKYPEPWLDWEDGNVYSKNPDKALVEKMIQIAHRLGGKVQGDDGEIYVDNSEVPDV